MCCEFTYPLAYGFLVSEVNHTLFFLYSAAEVLNVL
jgi:hypothetical protein